MSDQRERILACACDLYLRHGLEGFTMRKLAKGVGVTAPAIYRHYAGREEVIADVLREAQKTFTEYLYRALGAPTPLERFFGAGEGYLDFVFEHTRWYGMLFTAPENLGIEVLPADIERMGCSIHQFWIDRVRECMDAGILKKGDPDETSMTMWAHAHGMVQLYHQGHFRMGPDDFRKLFELSGARMMAGVATEEFARDLAERCSEAHQPAP
ncbi:MAG: TetR/AcrR family transcriptional regulator [Gemmatimonadetes bacterium]|nr:TetR/AcrR family transcriptional regulator [Gemmatimonadota bacterium]